MLVHDICLIQYKDTQNRSSRLMYQKYCRTCLNLLKFLNYKKIMLEKVYSLILMVYGKQAISHLGRMANLKHAR